MEEVHIDCKKCNKVIVLELDPQETADQWNKEIMDALDTHQRHLCGSCVYHFAECTGNPVFGECVGNDNVIECNSYKNRYE